ncbi:hypothetical protein BDZ94DRAFT_1311611 [Collybia nuda]|uniref:Uncharacterized protein n=1 Tax=Collybia nuda TaxID=64659 RepID=A0A9P6CC80_9AGAR|nr:hypothetical protein BDZ94DRAFT_1311611 [Collybia nuda]
MRALTPFFLCFTASSVVWASQIPIRQSEQSFPATTNFEEETWEFDLSLIGAREPSNSTSHLVFSTVSGLLQQWANTRYRNGHTIVPGTVPQGTLLYFGSRNQEIPTTPDWVATDPEHSYHFCRGREDVGCWQLTLMTTRPLNVLYFDGSSAGKMEGGPMDSQDMLLWGKVTREPIYEEVRRINELCDWGREFGLDGFVRMEMDFEIMLCDFTAGVEQVSHLNLVTEIPTPANSTIVNAGDHFPSLWVTVIESGAWHNQYPGEARIRLDLTRLVSFYDSSLVPSLVPRRYGKHRLTHRIKGMSSSDRTSVINRLREVLGNTTEPSSGVDWSTLLRVITQRFADRLELIQYFVNDTSDGSPSVQLKKLRSAQFQLRTMLTPYILFSSSPPPDSDSRANISWATPVFKHCATTHTTLFTTNHAISSRLTPSEKLILDAVRGTTKEICRVVVRLWAEGVMTGIDPVEPYHPSTPLPAKDINNMVARWRDEIDSLMGWLDWSVWVKCRPACSFEEMCYLPTWPFLRPSNPPHRDPQTQTGVKWPNQDNESEWLDPKPKCYRRVKPYNL